jgi:carbamoyltransferase
VLISRFTRPSTTDRYILGISAYYHDSAAVLLRNGDVVAAAQEERFSRQKGDARFPRHAVDCCLRAAGVGMGDLEAVGFYDKPLLKFERILETSVIFAQGSALAPFIYTIF